MKNLTCDSFQLILSSCSPYFEEVLSGISPFQHPVLFMKDIPFWVLKSLCDFMYAGEVHIFQNKLEELLAVAEILKVIIFEFFFLVGTPETGKILQKSEFFCKKKNIYPSYTKSDKLTHLKLIFNCYFLTA